MWRLIKNFNDLNYNSPELAFKVFKIPPRFQMDSYEPSFMKAFEMPNRLQVSSELFKTSKHFVPVVFMHTCTLLCFVT